MLARFLRIEAGALKAERIIASTLLIVILTATTGQVIARYVFNSPFMWTGELARFSMVWLTFIGATYVTATGGHITVDMIVSKLGDRFARATNVLVHIAVLGACALLLYSSWAFVEANQGVNSPALGVPLSWLYGVVAVTFGVMALHTGLRVWEAFSEGPASAAPTDAPGGAL